MLFFLTSSTETRLRDLPRDAVHCPEVLSSYSNTTKKKVSPYCFRFKKKSESHSVLGANTRDPTPNKAVREKTWRARPIRFSGVSKRPAHEIPPMTRSRGESLTGKACLNGLLPNCSDTGRKAFPDLFPNKNQFRTLINKFPRWWYFMRLSRVIGVF